MTPARAGAQAHNVAVAKILGYTVDRETVGHAAGLWRLRIPGGSIAGTLIHITEETAWEAVPRFTEDLAAAMTLVDPTIERGWRFILERGPGGRWVALFMNEDFCCIERAETAAQAIVAAFLSVSDTMQQVKEMQ